VVLENPAPEGSKLTPGQPMAAIDMQMGRRIHMEGPMAFPLWPMQSVTIIPGHSLRTDQYVLVEVEDENQAKVNVGKGITFRTASSGAGPQLPNPASGEAGSESQGAQAPQLPQADARPTFPTTLGERFIVKGTEVAFYMPPTGYRVIPNESNEYVRTAVSLERLEYCTLLDENGQRRIAKGPEVVFPQPTESFVEIEQPGGRSTFKGRAFELDEIKGLYIKVTQDYKEEDGKQRRTGDELFITGREQRIYYPRVEHAIISYGKQMVHYGIEIPRGDGRYVMNRKTGEIRLVKGETIFLPDPRDEVIVRRVLSDREVALLFPGNEEALEVNRTFRAAAGKQSFLEVAAPPEALMRRGLAASTQSFDRGTGYTPPRTITIDSKYDGAVRVRTFPGYAIMIVNGEGKRRIVKDGDVTLLEYDEKVHSFSLSSGTPKSDLRRVDGVYLQIGNNTVSDVVEVESRDLCAVRLRVAYRVNFEGDKPEKWFAVEDYIKLLTTNLRSMLRAAAKTRGIVELQQMVTEIVRDTILGKSGGEAGRPGRKFDENNMRVYDVDVLDCEITDPQIRDLIDAEQRAVFTHELRLGQIARETLLAKSQEDAAQQALELKAATAAKKSGTERARIEQEAANVALAQKLEADRAAAEADANRRQAEADLVAKQKLEEGLKAIEELRLELKKAADDHETEVKKARVAIDVDADEKRLKAMGDKIAEALTHSANAAAMKDALASFSFPVAGGENMAAVLSRAFSGTPAGAWVAGLLNQVSAKKGE
jgi:major vault protein